MRILAALALTSGLMLSSVGVVPAAAEPEGTQPPTDEAEDSDEAGDPSPTPTDTETDAEPTDATEDDDVEDGETDQEESGQQESEQHGPVEEDREEDATPPPAEQVRVDCTNVTIEPGQETSINCHTTPAGATLAVGAPSQIGGSLTVTGSQLLYSAPADGQGTDTFTVIASASEYEDGTTQLTIIVEAPQEVTQPPSSEESSPPAPPATTPAQDEPENYTGAQTPPTTPEEPESLPYDPSVPASPPVPRATQQTQEPAHLMLLPVPGMPRDPDMTTPGTSHHTGTQPSPEEAANDRYDSLATTGAGATFGAAGLAVLTLALGVSMLVTSRRIRQR